MATHLSDVVHTDPTAPRDVLVANPSRNDGQVFGTIGVAHDVDFSDGRQVSNVGRSQSVCVKPGEEAQALQGLADKLTGLNQDGTRKTIVVTDQELLQLRELIKSKYRDQQLVGFALSDLIDILTGAVNGRYSRNERTGWRTSSAD